MNFITQTLLPFVLLYKYGALFVVTFLSSFFLPIPPGSLIMASAALAHAGYFNIWIVFVVAVLGNITGDNAGYWIARRYGKDVLSRIGFRKVLASQKYKAIEARVIARPGFIIFISRFEVFANLAVNLITGLGKLSYRKFITYQIAGEIAQVALYGSIGYFFGVNWEALSKTVGDVIFILFGLLVILAVVFWKKWGKRKKFKQ